MNSLILLFNKDLRIVIVELSKLKRESSVEQLDLKEIWCYFIKELDRLTREDQEYLSRYEEMKEAIKREIKAWEQKRGKISQKKLSTY